MREAFIVGAVRTAGGKNHGRLSKIHPIDLGAAVIDELLKRTGMPSDKVDDVIVGCVNKIGAQGMNIGRNIVLSSDLNISVPSVTVDRQCGSGLQAVHFGTQAVMSGSYEIVIGMGVELMSLVPPQSSYQDGMEKGRGKPSGLKMNTRYGDSEFNQIISAEMLAQKYMITRDELDYFALRSHQKGAVATLEGRFKKEIMPVEIQMNDGLTQLHDVDEGILFDVNIEKIRSYSPLMENGVLTAASSGQINDGAAAVMIASAEAIRRYNLEPRARICAMAVVGSDPVLMFEGSIPATEKILKKAGLALKEMDLYEVNEAFGSVPLAWLKAMNADMEKMNVNGGAQSLGHPLGCTGPKLMTTLLHELERTGGRYGLIVLSEEGGTANAMIIERIEK